MQFGFASSHYQAVSNGCSSTQRASWIAYLDSSLSTCVTTTPCSYDVGFLGPIGHIYPFTSRTSRSVDIGELVLQLQAPVVNDIVGCNTHPRLSNHSHMEPGTYWVGWGKVVGLFCPGSPIYDSLRVSLMVSQSPGSRRRTRGLVDSIDELALKRNAGRHGAYLRL